MGQDETTAVLRLRAHAVGIARDIADAFAVERSDGPSTSVLMRQLADQMLAEPELVRAIARWNAAAEALVCGVKQSQPEAGMVLSRERMPSVHATPVLLEATALWAGATMGEKDGGVSFTSEQWAKFVQCLGVEPPLEILVWANTAVRCDRVDPACSAKGCERKVVCSGGVCERFESQRPVSAIERDLMKGAGK